MKRVVITIFAACAIAACAHEEVVNTSKNLEISFDKTFVEGTYYRTKVDDPSTTTESITGFNVWGYMENSTETVFNGDEVTKVDGVWTYENVQYWNPEKQYYFAGVSPMSNKNWSITLSTEAGRFGTLSFTNVDGTEDLLYSTAGVSTPDVDTMVSEGVEPVKMIFSHLLSKIKFTFVNALNDESMSIAVKDIKMTVPSAGTIDLAYTKWWESASWKLSEENTVLSFGRVNEIATGQSASTALEHLTIPTGKSYEYEISFSVDVYKNQTYTMTINKTVKLSSVEINMGKGYNLRAEITVDNLGLVPIEFEVEEVKDWIEG